MRKLIPPSLRTYHRLIVGGVMVLILTPLITELLPPEGLWATLFKGFVWTLFSSVIVAIIPFFFFVNHPERIPFFKYACSWQKIALFANQHRRRSILTGIAAFIFLLSMLWLGRTLWIRSNNDLFHFGYTNRWWSYLIVNYFHTAASIDIYGPGRPNTYGMMFSTGPSVWFYYHVVANGGTWSISGGPLPTVVSHDYILFGSHTSYLSGIQTTRTYWFDIPFPGPIITLLSSIPILFWLRAYLRHIKRSSLSLCSNCSYDLRAHHAGDKCPEC